MLKKLISILFSAVMLVASFGGLGCNTPASTTTPSEPTEPTGSEIINWIPTFNKAETIGSFICKDDDAGNDTINRFGVGGTDLGISVNLKNGETLLLFGDTFTNEWGWSNGQNYWRSGVVGKTSDTDLSDNLRLDSFWTNDAGFAEEEADSPLWSRHKGGVETTKIYTGGIEIENSIYLFFVSRVSGTARENANNFGGCIKSIDGGVTWHRVWDLTWVDHIEGRAHPTEGDIEANDGVDATMIEKLVNYDTDGNYVENAVDITNRQAYHFTQMYPIMGEDGYVYMLGRGGYRTSGIKLARVKPENFEEFNAYEYYCGRNKEGKEEWGNDPEKAAFIVNRPLSNMSIVYNKYINKWVLSYLDCTEGSGAPLVVSYSSFLTSGWSRPITLIENAGDTKGLYGGYLNERWVENDGQTFYFIYSRFIRYNDDSTTEFHEPDNNVYRSYIAKATVDRREPGAKN